MKEYTLSVIKKSLLTTLKSSGVALVCAGLLIFIGAQIQKKVASITKARHELVVFTAKYDQFDQLKKEYEQVKDAVPKLENILPTLDTVTSVVDYMNDLGVKTNNTVAVQFHTISNAQLGSLSGIGFALQANGTLSSLRDLLSYMENAPYLISISNIYLTMDQANNQTKADMGGVVYIQEQK